MDITTVEIEKLCRTSVDDLKNVLGSASYPFTMVEDVGLQKALLSTENTVGLKIEMDDGKGKENVVAIEYMDENIDVVLPDGSVSSSCAPTEKLTRKYADVVLEHNLAIKPIMIDEADLKEMCMGKDEMLSIMLLNALNKSNIAFEQRLAALMAAGYGAFYGGIPATGTYKDISFLRINEDGQKYSDTDGSIVLKRDFKKIGYKSRPIMVGDSENMDYFNNMLDYSCCNSAGVDVGRLNPHFSYWMSNHVPSVLGGADRVMVWNPGSVQLLTRNNFAGDFAFNFDGTQMRGTLVSPYNGLTYDLEMTYHKCVDDGEGGFKPNNHWGIALNLKYDIWFNPATFAAGTDKEDINGVFPYNITSFSAYNEVNYRYSFTDDLSQVNPSQLTIVAAGEGTAEVLNDSTGADLSASCTYTSSAAGVFTVVANTGVITGVAAGTATLKIVLPNGTEKYYTVVVTAAP